MPDVEENKQDLVDIDTSGPGAEVDIEETKEERLKKLLNVSKVSVGKTWRRKYETSTSTNKRRNKKGS